MASPSQDASTLLASSSAAPVAHEGAARVFWRVLTRFDSSKLSPYLALRNSIGVLLPLVAGFALDMPRGGLVVASGALNVAYSDGSDSYAQRAKRMLSSSGLCALAVLFGALSGSHSVAAVTIATLWAFAAGMLVAAGTTAADLAVISLVTLLIYAAQPLTPRQALISTGLALGGGLLQTALSVALWPVQRYEPERRALANFFLELARAAEQPLSATTAPPATVHSTQAQEALSSLDRERSIEAVRYRALLSQAERIRLSLLMLSRLHLRMQRESPAHSGVQILGDYVKRAAQVLQEVSNSLISATQAEACKEVLAACETLTLLVLKPEFTTTFSRGLLRIAGTIVGLFLATALFRFLPDSATVQIVLIFVFALLLRWVGPANYGIFAVAISALVVLLIAMTGVSPKEVIWARGINTAAGGALALLAYWIWPTWERTQVFDRIAAMLDAYREYFHALAETYVRNETSSVRELDRVRLRAHMARTNLESSIDRLSAEL